MSKTMAKARPLGGERKLTEEEKKAAMVRMLAQKHETFFQGILFNAINSGAFGKDLDAAVDASAEAAERAMEKLFRPAEESKPESGEE